MCVWCQPEPNVQGKVVYCSCGEPRTQWGKCGQTTERRLEYAKVHPAPGKGMGSRRQVAGVGWGRTAASVVYSRFV